MELREEKKMKRLNRFFASIVVAAMMLGFCGCSNSDIDVLDITKTNYLYDNGDKYEAGDRDITEKIESINIAYMSGEVVMTETDADVVSIKETSPKELDDKRKVHTWVDGSTLYVRYCASARGLELNNLDKKLTIDIPRNIELSDVKLELSSGDADISCSAKNYDLNASSGGINLTQRGDSDSINMEVTSGGISVNYESVDKINVSASSGSIYLKGNSVNDFKSEVTSGNGDYTFNQLPKSASLSASSGNINIYIPKDADLTLTAKKSSGDMSTEHAFTKDGDTYVSGSGTNKMNVSVTSGDIMIKDIAE